MADRRRYTGARTLQFGWTVAVVALAVLIEVVLSGLLPTVVTVGGGSLVWMVGLVAFGLRDRRHWTRLVERSSFDATPSGHTADLQQIVRGKSVTVTTGVAGLLSPEHTKVRAPVEGVDASFTVRIVDTELTDRDGLSTGVDALDERFAITGTEGNVAAILTETVGETLLAIETPGTYSISTDQVVYEVPFTQVTAAELDAAGEAVAVIADRVEAVEQK